MFSNVLLVSVYNNIVQDVYKYSEYSGLINVFRNVQYIIFYSNQYHTCISTTHTHTLLAIYASTRIEFYFILSKQKKKNAYTYTIKEV